MASRKLPIFITAANEPLVVNGFLKEIIKAKGSQIIGIALVRGKGPVPRVSRGRKNKLKGMSAVVCKVRDILSLILIFGVVAAIRNAGRVLYFHFSKAINRLLPFYPTNSIEYIARQYGLPVTEYSTINDASLLDCLESMKPDIIINQAPGILGERFLRTASVGVLNRHNGLLPKNRGRLSPFWALYRREEYSGVSIHFVVKELDAGEIVVQERIKISETETVTSLVRKCYAIAPAAMIRAIEKLESGEGVVLPNPDEEATYNTNPTMKEVIHLWKRRWRPALWLPRIRASISSERRLRCP